MFTFLISAMISFGSLDDVVFILHVNRNDRGLISPLSLTTFLCNRKKYLLRNCHYVRIDFRATKIKKQVQFRLTPPLRLAVIPVVEQDWAGDGVVHDHLLRGCRKA